MYIYQTLPSGIPADEDWNNVTEGMRIIELDGHPAPVVGIRYKATDKVPQSMGAARTESGRLAGPRSKDILDFEYWADRPSGLCGGQRARTSLKEDFAVSASLGLHESAPALAERRKGSVI